jgi:transcriptional regulator with XRE-family HTH domain
MQTRPKPGQLLRSWRQQRRLSQLDLACEAQISTRHLNFVETGRARPSRQLILHLGELLELPLRERNRLLLAAGFAPAFPERALDEPALDVAMTALRQILTGHEPSPALVIDRHWNLLLANRAAERLLASVDPALLCAPVNVLRLTLDPRGLAPLIVNLGEWRHHLLRRLRRLVAHDNDPAMCELLTELSAWPPLPGEQTPVEFESHAPDVAVLFRFRSPLGELRLIGTLTTFGSPLDVSLSELALEAFYPADAQTAELLRALDG